jgi:hypothetical protein
MSLPKPSLAGAAGGGWCRKAIIPMSGPDAPTYSSDLPLPRWGVLSGKISLHEPPLAAVLRAAS